MLNENTDLKFRYEKLIQEYKTKTKDLDENYQILQDKFDKLKIDFNQNLALNNNLNIAKTKYETEFKKANELSNERKIRIEELEKELENLKFLFESTTQDNKLEFKIQIEKLNKELNAKWEDILK